MKYYEPYDVNDPNAPGGWRPRENPKREVAENFDPYHDELGRFTTKDGAATPRSADGPHSRDWRDKNKSVFIAQTQVNPTPTPAPQALTQVDHGPLTFDKLLKHYPTLEDYPTDLDPESPLKSIWDLIGGKVLLNRNDPTDTDYRNTCAIRLSYALNRSGCTIPYLEGLVSSGTDKMWYIYSVKALDAYLRRNSKFGTPETFSPKTWKSEINIDPKTGMPKLRRGIIEFKVPNVWPDATGHFTLFNGSGPIGEDYSDIATEIDFWPLPLN